MTKQEMFAHLSAILQDTFDIPAENIRPESRLYEDLDIDSIDAVDLIVKLKPIAGKRLQPDAFKSVRTLQDVVDALHGLLTETPEPSTPAHQNTAPDTTIA
ncbi:acyl carrier protein [Undibacterium sp. TJN25]|uniref:acyl carrier protein n=1 Tax=Undibacterium sp. TJN25 TaxID=3413056 RepID=UPI003BF27E8C